MKNTQSLKQSRDFRRVYRSDNIAGGYIVIYACKNRYCFNRLGLTAGKSYGKAVERNRIKRLMRESYRLMEDSIKTGYDFIIVARHRAAGRTQAQIQKDMSFILKKMDLIKSAADKDNSNEENSNRID